MSPLFFILLSLTQSLIVIEQDNQELPELYKQIGIFEKQTVRASKVHIFESQDFISDDMTLSYLKIYNQAPSHMFIERCYNQKQISKNVDEFPRITEIDKFSEEFEKVFQKIGYHDSFLNDDLQMVFQCKGIYMNALVQENAEVRKQVAEQMKKFIFNYILTETIVEQPEFFDFDLNDIFSFEFIKPQEDQNANFSFVIERKDITFEKFNWYNSVLFHYEEPNLRTNADFSKNLKGAGLHQNIEISLAFDEAIEKFPEGTNNCTLTIEDYLETDQYVDIEEFYQSHFDNNSNQTDTQKDQAELFVHEVIDIERPSFLSRQHFYKVEYLLNQKDFKEKEGRLFFNKSLSYPFHFRYRKAEDGYTYKNSYLTQHPYIFISCLDNEYLLLKNNKVQTQTKIPCADKSKNPQVTHFTFAITLLSSLFVIYALIKK